MSYETLRHELNARIVAEIQRQILGYCDAAADSRDPAERDRMLDMARCLRAILDLRDEPLIT